MKYICLSLILAFSASAVVDTKNTAADTIKFNQDNQIDIMVAEDADAFLYLQSSVMKWLESNKSRVRDYDTAYEIPLIEVKTAGFLIDDQFLRKPGDVSGDDERAAIWHPYTVKVMKVGSLTGDQFKVLLTTGAKSPVLPATFNPNCYIFISYIVDGVTNPAVNWRYLDPMTASNGTVVEMKIDNTTCQGHLATIGNKARFVLDNWYDSGLPAPHPTNPNPQCGAFTSAPPWVVVPGDHEDVAHCIYRYTSASPNYCQGVIRITNADGSTTASNLDRKTTSCSPGHLPAFLVESNAYIANAGLTLGPISCNIVNPRLVRCNASENAGNYCQGSIHIIADDGTITNDSLSRKSTNCVPGHIPQFLSESNSYIASAGIATGAVSCSIANTHNVSCSTSGGVAPEPGVDDCEVFKYDIDGVLPLVPSSTFTGRDCRGMSDVAGLTIVEYLVTQENVATVFVLNGDGTTNFSRINSNGYCDYHFNADGVLGNMFDNKLYYNCDEVGAVQNYQRDYNATASAEDQIVNCAEFAGPLDPITLKHKATCDSQDANNIVVILGSGTYSSEWEYVPYDPVGDLPANGFSTIYIVGLQGNGGVNNGVVAQRNITMGDVRGDTDVLHFSNWITLPTGVSIADLINAGYSYSMSYTKVYDTSDGTNPHWNFCETEGGGDLMSGSFGFRAEADIPSEGGGGITCIWDAQITEFKNGAATGISSPLKFRIDIK